MYPVSELVELWSRSVDPKGMGMAEAIAGEIASYTGEQVDVVLERMTVGTESFKRLWEASHVTISDPKSVEAFYRDQLVEAYELANWHCGRTNGVPPLNYARAAVFARWKGLRDVLDFGCGIGTGSICLASVGCEVHSADIAIELLTFAEYRFRKRGVRARVIDLGSGECPNKRYYDMVVCLDVLEHIPNQLAKLRELSSYLREGGYLLVNLMNDSRHPHRPMHISSAGNWLALVRKTNMRPDWLSCSVGIREAPLQVLVRTRGGRFYNYVASWVDWLQEL